MTTYTFQPTTTAQFVDWSDPAVWTGDVVPDGARADVIIPVVTLSGGGTDASFISIASDESYSVHSVSLASNYLTINGDLTVAVDFAIQAGGEIDMGGGTLAAGTLENDGIDIQGDGQVNTTGVLTNDSSIIGTGLTLALGGLVNDGTLEAASGNLTLQVPSGFAEFSDGRLTGGTYAAGYNGNSVSNSNTLYLDVGGVVTTDGATISLDGGGAIDSYDSANSSYVSIESTMGLIAAAGTLSLADQTYDWQTPLTVAGALSLSSASEQDEAVLDATQLTIDPGGIVSGGGTIDSPIANSGVVSAGLLTASAAQSGLDELNIQGPVTGNGTIEIAKEQITGYGLHSQPFYTTATLELGGPDSNNVSFADGTGTLQLDDPSAFRGTITPGGSGDQIILSDVSSASVTGYEYVGSATGGTLTIDAGGTAYTPNFAGDFETSSFSLSAGPQLFTSSAPSLLAVAHGAPVTPATSSNILWRDINGDTALWNSNSSGGFTFQDLGVIPSTWQIEGTGDFNGKGDGVLWRNINGDTALWNSNGSGSFTFQDLGIIPSSWLIEGTGDFNGSGADGVLWQNIDGDTALWSPNGSRGFTFQDLGVIPTSWQIEGTGDFNGGGADGVLWRNSSTGDVALWNSNGSEGFAFQDLGGIPSTWQIEGTGDFNGKGDGVLWRNINGDTALWNSNGSGGFTFQDLGIIPSSWLIEGTGDFNGTGADGVLWRNSSTGDVALWNPNGSGSFTFQDLGVIPSSWQIFKQG
jgi:hypothetical protein